MPSARETLHALVWTRRHVLGQLKVPELAFLRGHLSPTDICIDVGAHGGRWTAPLARLVPGGTVYAFEALPYYARVLRTTLRLLRRKNVVLIDKAVQHEPGSVQIVWRDASGNRIFGLTHIRGGDEQATKDVVTVPAITLDSMQDQFDGRVRLLKLDIEGAELLALRGADDLIARHRPLVYTELYDEYCLRYGHAAKDVFAFFAARDYRGFTAESDTLEPVNAETYGGRGDVWFIPADEASAFTKEAVT